MLACVATLGLSGASASGRTSAPAGDPRQLSPAQVAAQVAAAEALRAQILGSKGPVGSATLQVIALSDRSSLLLERLSEAQADQRAATVAERTHRTSLAALKLELAGRQDAIGRWAHDTYVRGNGALEDLAAQVEVLTAGDPGQGVDGVAMLRYLADQRTRSFERLTTLAGRQEEATRSAAAARHEAQQAATAVAALKSTLDTTISQQQEALAALRRAEASTARSAATLRTLLAAAGPGAPSGRVLVSVVGTCRADSATYPNGRLPASALCPVDAAPGRYLRESPARAFNALSKAYQQETGHPLCVTDGYRTYAEQVAVFAGKPTLAARPGTSQHGLGLAVDMCGGVQSFGTPAHLWMKQHAPLYGWFHPAWAEPSGSKPEPWHWEFAG